jgi:hypothetical protein
MCSHKVRPTVPLSATRKRTGGLGAFEAFCVQGRVRSLATEILQMLLQRLFLKEDLITMLTLILSRRIMTVQMHTQSAGLGGCKCALGADIQTGLILQILALSRHFKWIERI